MSNETTTVERGSILGAIVAGYFSNNTVSPNEVEDVMASITRAAERTIFAAPVLENASEIEVATPHRSFADLDLTDTDAVIAATVFPEHILSLLDGKEYKTLKRHLGTNGMTVDEYLTMFNLPSDYPTVAPEYSKRRSAMAKNIGLGKSTKRTSTKSAASSETSNSSSGEDSESDSRRVTFNPEGHTLPEGVSSIEDTYTDNHIICLEDGEQVKMLKRYLKSRYSMTVDDYRSKWGLPEDYPIVAPATSRAKSESMTASHEKRKNAA